MKKIRIQIILAAATLLFNSTQLMAETRAPFTSLQCNQFTFDATKSYLPDNHNISLEWNLGDGTTNTNPIVNHTYERSGDYNVTLTITDNYGDTESISTSNQLVRVNIPPEAEFTNAETACINDYIEFDASQSTTDKASNLDYFWKFGDGTTAQGVSKTKKSYTKGGKYKVSLKVDDQNKTACSTHSVEKIIQINEPPKADFGDDVILKCVTSPQDMLVEFDASASTDVNNDQLSFIWDFGDGQNAQGQTVTHQYNEVGNYDAKLIVTDNSNLSCNTGVAFAIVKLNKAPTAHAGDDMVACPNENIVFDGSQSDIEKKGTELAKWFFGDGRSAHGLTVTHSYAMPGTYQATLSVENKLNAMCPISKDTRNITINSVPSITIKALKSACANQEVFFDASGAVDADGDQLTYYWNFGDGTVSTLGSKVSHVYQQGGSYRVSVVVDDNRGTICSTVTTSTHIVVNTPPVADAGLNLSCCINKEILFDARASKDPDGNNLTYTWDFGDGGKAQGEVTTHTYTQSGSYNVVITVNDNTNTTCSQSTDSFTAVANDIPVSVINIR